LGASAGNSSTTRVPLVVSMVACLATGLLDGVMTATRS
jgi:hypothetical protein